ncbi:MAG: thioesterase [Mariniphaga sp.]|nr:thioesterase [Mariniphaga sp.]
MKHIKELSTKSYFIDRFGKLSTAFMFYQMQEIAWEHANLLGFGYHHLKQENQFWVLSRLQVKIDRRPVWTEKFTLKTWSRGTDGFYGYRDFVFEDNAGNDLIRATSSWLILDAGTKRIVRLSKFSQFPEYSESILEANQVKISRPEAMDALQFSPVLFNEIDINQHFNSGRYIERIMDSYDFQFHEDYELKEFTINFLKEGLPSDRLAVNKQRIHQHTHLCSVVRENDYADLVRAILIWRDRHEEQKTYFKKGNSHPELSVND